MSYVPIPVLEDYVPEVYELLARLTRSHVPPVATDEEPAREAVLSEGLVIRMYRESDEGGAHQRLMDHLADVAEEDGERWVRSSELMKVLGKSRVQLRGVFGAFGRRANNRYEGAKPWDAEWDHGEGEYGYRVKPDVAAAIRKAQAAS